MDVREALRRLNERTTKAFASENRVVSFREYLEEFRQDPVRAGRIAATYLADCFDHFGTYEVERIGGKATRWRLFDAPFDNGRDQLVGQEDIQKEVYQALRSFQREGRADKLVFLHGPNGSAKTTFCELLFRSLEQYSRQAEGALHRFSWIFPTREAQGKKLGFTDERVPTGASREETYAYLAHDEIAAKISCEMKDPPFFLIPSILRKEMLPELWDDEGNRRVLRHLFEGDLCAKCKKIWDGLFKIHRGNLLEVLRHVQVERYFVSQRYRRGAVRVAPQSHVDAGEVQITADRSVTALPAALQDINLFVPLGDLIDGNQGVVEFSDFLKRPLEMNKYLLTTCEKGIIHLQTTIAYLNVVLIGTSNEAQLDEFKKMGVFPSFGARMELVTMPYLLQFSLEEEVYKDAMDAASFRKHVSPHVARMAAMWAVLCRMHRPNPDNYPADLRHVIREMKPIDKARLYDDGSVPGRLTSEERGLLRSHVAQLREEWRDSLHYEGRYGPSAREMRGALMDCRYDQESECFSPVSLFRQLKRLVKDKSLYEFLRVEPDGGYHDAEGLIEVVMSAYADIVADEVRGSMRLVEPDEYRKIFARYVQHVNALRGGELVESTMPGKMEAPDEKFIAEVEAVIAGTTPSAQYREGLIRKIGAWGVDHPEKRPDYMELFPEAVEAIREDYYRRNKKIIEDVRDNLIRHGTEDLQDLEVDLRRRVVDTMDAMVNTYGYCPACAKEAVAFLSHR